MGCFINFEGCDASGKSTQARLLHEALKDMGHSNILTSEPTKDTTGLAIREYLGTHTNFNSIEEENEFIGHLCLVDRYHHIFNKHNGLATLLAEGRTIVNDRYYYTTMAYNYGGKEVNEYCSLINSYMLNRFPTPDLTIYLKITPELAIDRLSKLNNLDKYETLDKQISVINNYDEMIDVGIMNAQIIDGSNSVEYIHNEILKLVNYSLVVRKF